MAAIITHLDRAKLDVMLKQPEGEVGRWLGKRAELIANAARAQVGKRTGRLASSIHIRHSRTVYGQSIKIGSSLHYALLHHEGTRPHLITGRNGPLRFSAKGRVVYTHTVIHPGTKPNRYLSDNLRLLRT
jgi:hypothetical protein